MGYISVKILNIQIPNDFRVYVKPDGGESKPHPIDSASGGWESYGTTAGYSGGTTEIWIYGTGTGYTYDFEYGTTYWIKLEEIDYPERYVIKNIRIFDAIAYGELAPSATPSVTITPSRPISSVTRTATPTPTPPVTRSITPTVTKTPTVTPTIGTSHTPSVSTSQPAVISQIYFGSLTSEIGNLSVLNSAGRTFSIIFNYHLNANCNNDYSNGESANEATSYLFISTNSGSTWNEIASITAEVSGGNYPVMQSDNQDLYGTYTLTGITDVAGVRVHGQYDCAWAQDDKDGSIDVTITGATVNSGVVVVICNNSYHAGCLETPYLYCTGLSTTPSVTPSRTPSRTITPSVTPNVIEITVYNDSGADTLISDVQIDGLSIIPNLYEINFPLWPGENTKGRSQTGSGIYPATVYIQGWSSGTKYLTFTDSMGTVHCQNLNLGDSQVTFSSVYLNTTGVADPYRTGNTSGYIIFYNGGMCPSPPPVTPSITPTITRTPSNSTTPGLSPTVTPSKSPTVFGYYIDIYGCIGSSCGNYLGNAMIENIYYLTPGYWYKYDSSTLYYITSTAPTGGDVTNVSGIGYSTCNDACAAS